MFWHPLPSNLLYPSHLHTHKEEGVSPSDLRHGQHIIFAHAHVLEPPSSVVHQLVCTAKLRAES